MIAASLATTMPTVKVLALDYVGPDLDPVLDILRCFTCLESLYIYLCEYPYYYLFSLPKMSIALSNCPYNLFFLSPARLYSAKL
jgi:hypothetical protein